MARKSKGTVDYAKLALDFAAARQAAMAISRADGGTCNFDSAVLNLGDMDPKKVEEAARQAKLGGNCDNWLGCDWFFVSPPQGGQAALRTLQAKAIEKVMTAAGWDMMIYYQMD